MNWDLITIFTLPALGTALGAAMVFLIKNKIGANTQKMLLGFAAGVMMAASIWSLLIPSMEIAQEQGAKPWLMASTGFLAGMGFLLLLDTLIPHLHIDGNNPEGIKTNFKKSTMLVLAITLHNIPEGMAVGVVLGGAITGQAGVTMAGAMALALGMAIQNIPEGAVVSIPLRAAGKSRRRAFIYGGLSGLVEPLAAIITVLLIDIINPMLPFLLAFAAGSMIYVVVEELIPESQAEPHNNIGTIGVAIGFVLMMVLDVVLG